MKKLLMIVFVAAGLFACQAQTGGKTLVNTDEFKELSQQEDVYVIDVRTPAEVSASYISETDYFFDVNNPDFAKNIATLDKDKTYIVYCRSGARSSNAIAYMQKQGFTNLYELAGGILSWKDSKWLQTK